MLDELLVLKAYMSALSIHGVSKRIDENDAHAFIKIWVADLLQSLPLACLSKSVLSLFIVSIF